MDLSLQKLKIKYKNDTGKDLPFIPRNREESGIVDIYDLVDYIKWLEEDKLLTIELEEDLDQCSHKIKKRRKRKKND